MMAGRDGSVKPNMTRSVWTTFSPSLRYIGLKAMISSSRPVKAHGRVSSAVPESDPPADRMTSPSENCMRICALRSVTSATRRIASCSGAISTVAMAVCDFGRSGCTLGKSASSMRVVVSRLSAWRPKRPSAPMLSPAPTAISIGLFRLLSSVRAFSCSVFAGTSSFAETSSATGSHSTVRIARRKRSVAASWISEPSISMCTPVSIGKVSSLPAAATTWVMASTNSCGSMVPVSSGRVGSCG